MSPTHHPAPHHRSLRRLAAALTFAMAAAVTAPALAAEPHAQGDASAALPVGADPSGPSLLAHPLVEHADLTPGDQDHLDDLIAQRTHATPVDPTAARPQSAYSYRGAPYYPADLWHLFGTPDQAYATAQNSNTSSVPGPSASTPLVAVIESGTYPRTASSLAKFRADQTLPPCPAGSCLSVVNQAGSTTSLPGPDQSVSWEMETDIDVDVISSVCPQCRILVVGANSAQTPDLVAAISTAVRLGAGWVSMSLGTDGDCTCDFVSGRSVFNDPNVVFTAATGDYGYVGGSWPSSSPYVIASGGVTLNASGSAVSSTAWNQAGSGCADIEHPMGPSQARVAAAVAACGQRRAASDIASIADPATGVLVYTYNGGSTGSYYLGGGTSAAAPAIAALYALVGNRTDPYAIYENHEAHPEWFTDVTTGNTDLGHECSTVSATLCNAKAGWDGPTGLGLPNSINAVTAPGSQGGATTTLAAPTYVVSALRAAQRSSALSGGQVIAAASGAATTTSKTGAVSTRTVPYTAVSFTASGLPAGFSLDSAAQTNADGSVKDWVATIVGAPTKTGSGVATVQISATAIGATAPVTTVQVPWTVTAPTLNGGHAPKVKGVVKIGRRLQVSKPKILAVDGAKVAHAKWTYTWLINGKRVQRTTKPSFLVPTSYAKKAKVKGSHGRRAVLARVKAGTKITFQATASAPGYQKTTWSVSLRVKR